VRYTSRLERVGFRWFQIVSSSALATHEVSIPDFCLGVAIVQASIELSNN